MLLDLGLVHEMVFGGGGGGALYYVQAKVTRATACAVLLEDS